MSLNGVKQTYKYFKEYYMKSGFIYLWCDTKRNKYYLGSHVGNIDDGCIGMTVKEVGYSYDI
jgi:hypothetical protein